MGFDSLDLVEFSMAVQKEFDLPDLGEEDFANLKVNHPPTHPPTYLPFSFIERSLSPSSVSV